MLPSLKSLLIIPLFIICGLNSMQAQNTSVSPDKLYETWIYPINGYKGKPRMLFELKDSAVLLSDSRNKMDYTSGNYKLSKLDIKNIDVIKVRRKGQGAALVAGIVSGAVVGGILMIVYSNHLAVKSFNNAVSTGTPDVPKKGGNLEAIVPFLVSSAIGTGAGILLSLKVKIPIHREQSTYELNKQNLNNYTIQRHEFVKIVPVLSFSFLPDSVTDFDGNSYHTLALGGQVWMTENLKVAHFSNGDSISEVQENSEWGKSVGCATCWYQNNKAGGRKYGRLYNWNAVADSRGLCPKGWHVPSMPDMESLVASLGGGTDAGKKLLNVIKQKADSSSSAKSFSNPFAHPVGFRFNTGQFSPEETSSCQWWSSTPGDSATAKSLQLGDTESGVFFSGSDKRSGLSVRCLRD